MLWLLALLMYSMVIVNETVDISVSDALLDDCRGRVEISGNSKLAHFNGTVIAKNATLIIVNSDIGGLYCYNSTVKAYYNTIKVAQLENCTFIASMNSIFSVFGNKSVFGNDLVTFSLGNDTYSDYVGNYWFFANFVSEPVDSDRNYISDTLVCIRNIKIDGSHYCEKPLLAMHVSYKFHGAQGLDNPGENSPENQENALTIAMDRLLAALLSAVAGIVTVAHIYRRGE